jgi:Chitobiase/beta-hexosaminidase C-terminal domain
LRAKFFLRLSAASSFPHSMISFLTRAGSILRVPAAILFATFLTVGADVRGQAINAAHSERIPGQTWQGERGVAKTTAEIMSRAAMSKPRQIIYLKRELEIPGRENRPHDPNAQPVSRSPESPAPSIANMPETGSPAPQYPQTVSTNFNAVTGPTETGAFPPDSMGAVGPAQFIVFVNGRLRTFTKATGLADGVINVDPDDFFSSVMTPEPAGQNFTSDPQIRFDRLTNRWILTIIDAPSSSPSALSDLPNRLLIAVSDAASAGVISASTVWAFYFVQQNTLGGADTGEFLDYDSLGVDKNALYVGGNMFDAATRAFVTTSAFVINKNSILTGGPVVATAFRGLITGGDGPDSPRGVDNFDPAATEGYIIGTSDTALGRLILRRVSDPGGLPTISGNIAITVNDTSNPINVGHLGNTRGDNGLLDGLDDRLYAAHIRNGKLWTAHTIAVTASGVASSVDVNRRDAARWYELDVPVGAGTPTVVQSGTVFDSAADVASARQFWIPSVMVSGQGHAALGFSAAGTAFRIDAASNGRLVGDTLGTLQTPTLLTAGNTAYNPPGDPGFGGRRWGDYSFTSLDPGDDMTMWTVQEYCNATNTYGVRVTKLLAPPPATPAVASPNPAGGIASSIVSLTGISVSGSGFFDPGAGFSNRISANVGGGVTVNSITYISPTQVTLSVNTMGVADGAYDVTVTNPDGQSRTASGILAVGSATPSPSPSPTPTPAPTPLPTPSPPAPYGEIYDPPPGSVLPNTQPVTFSWTQGNATAFWLIVGSTIGGTDIFSSGQTGGLFFNVNSVPTDGRTIYVRLRSLVGGTWYLPPQDYTYRAFPGGVLPPVISPVTGKYKKKVTVNMASQTPNCTIYYTTDGTTPTSASPVFRSPTKSPSPFTLTKSSTVKAKAVVVGSTVPDSPVVTATYTISRK